MNSKISGEIRERIIRNFIDLIILKEIRKNTNISGYDVITLLHRKFHVLLSPGSVYSILYAMERKGLVEGIITKEKRVYRLTKKGEQEIKYFLSNLDTIHLFIQSLFRK